MRLLERGSFAYEAFDRFDRWWGYALFGERRWVSALLGDRLKNGTALWYHKAAAAVIDFLTFEEEHCLKNAGKK